MVRQEVSRGDAEYAEKKLKSINRNAQDIQDKNRILDRIKRGITF